MEQMCFSSFLNKGVGVEGATGHSPQGREYLFAPQYFPRLSTYTDELDQLDMQLLLDDCITRNDYRRHTFALSNKSH